MPNKNTPLIPAYTAVETFRDAGYRSTAAALAEAIDNSIEAGASTIQILTFEEPVHKKHRTVYRITKIAMYDDGCGMDVDTLQQALQFGMGTRLNTRNGIGRFGIGLPNASVSQCRHTKVYSWQKGKCHSTYLDIDEIKKSKQQNANPVIKCELPLNMLEEVSGGYDKKSGTLIVWEKCDRLDIKRSKTLYSNMEKDLCRIYRHFLDNDNSYGNKVDIRLIVTGHERVELKLLANDPIYQLIPNNTPGFENQSTNELHGSVIKLDIPYGDEGKTSTVEMRFTVASPEIQALGGNSAAGKHYRRNTGISFVRACREIDFGNFGFFNPHEERERWWGCEVRFNPELDELFGVTNNKQSVRGIHYLDTKQFQEEHGEHWEEEIAESGRLHLRYLLSKAFTGNHTKIKDTIIARHKGKKSLNPDNPNAIDKPTKVANEQLKDSKEKTKSQIDGSGKTEDDKRNEWLISLEQEGSTLTEEELESLAETKSRLKIDVDYGSWPGEQFFTLETRGETSVVVINKKHRFYTDLYEPLGENGDSRLSDALDLMMMAYARTEDELYSFEDQLQGIRSKWGHYVHKFLKALQEEA